MSIAGREGVDNTLPETACKSEQPRRRGQAVLLREVGSPSEVGSIYASVVLTLRRPANRETHQEGLAQFEICPKPWRCLAPKVFLKRAASMGGYMESFVADAFGVGRVHAASPTALRSVFTQLREQELDKEHHRDR